MALLVVGAIGAVGASVWRPLLFLPVGLWALTTAAAVLDARLRGRLGVVTGVVVAAVGPLAASAGALVHRRAVRKVTRRYASAVPLAFAFALAGGVVATLAGRLLLGRVAFAASVPSNAMAGRLRAGDLLLVSPWLGAAPSRGQIVAVGSFPAATRLGRHGRVIAVLRVVGLAGEWIGDTGETQGLYVCVSPPDITHDVHRQPGCVFLDESAYATAHTAPFGPVRVRPDAVYLLGDRRTNLEDSRTFGSIPNGAIVGKVVATLWPPARLGVR